MKGHKSALCPSEHNEVLLHHGNGLSRRVPWDTWCSTKGIRGFVELPKLDWSINIYWDLYCFLWARILEGEETNVWLGACSVSVLLLPKACFSDCFLSRLGPAGGLVWAQVSFLPGSQQHCQKRVYHQSPIIPEKLMHFRKKPDLHGVTTD